MEWKEVMLQDVVSILGDGLHGTPEYDDNGEYFFINGNNLGNRKIIIKENTRRTNKDEYDRYKKDLNERTIFVSINGTIGNVGTYKGEKCILGKSACYFNVLDGVDKDFMVYVATNGNFQTYISEFAHGTTIKNVSLRTIREYPFLLPDLAEQKSIASVLSSLDDKIDLLHRQNKTLEAMAETLFRQWFVEGDDEDCLITDLVEFNPIRKLSKGAMVPYLEMATLSTTTFNPDGWYDREFSSGMKFINGDTLLARITPCLENGKTAFITFLAENQVGWGSTEYIVMRPVEFLHPFFAYALARNQVFREYAEGCMAGSSGRQRVDIDHLKFFKICKPTNEAVIVFNEMANSVVPKLNANMVQIKTLEKLRDGLLPKLMSGEVRITNA